MAFTAAILFIAVGVSYLPQRPRTPEPEPETPPEVVVIAPPAAVPDAPAPRHEGIVVLHIGDSHTAADIFTGRVRDLLEERFGAGGVLLPPGNPQAGVRSNVFQIEASDGWTYERIRPSEHRARFWVSGYTAEARTTGASMTYTAYGPMRFTAIDLSFVTQPEGGAVEVLLDGEAIETLALDGGEEPLIRRLIPVAGFGSFETLTVRATNDRPVIVTGVRVIEDGPGDLLSARSASPARVPISSSTSTPRRSRTTSSASTPTSSCSPSAPMRGSTTISASTAIAMNTLRSSTSSPATATSARSW